VPVVLLILESFGTSELLLILVVALIFFGPRKLPQLSRQIGKSLAEFRKASEDFKRTWEREVALETAPTEPDQSHSILPRNDSIIETTVSRTQALESMGQGAASLSSESLAEVTSVQHEIADANPAGEVTRSEHASKRDWL
jgi:Tat protein translocase TatB subunit